MYVDRLMYKGRERYGITKAGNDTTWIGGLAFRTNKVLETNVHEEGHHAGYPDVASRLHPITAYDLESRCR